MSTNIPTQPDTDRPTSSTGGTWVSDGTRPASRLRGPARRSLPHLLVGVLLVVGFATAFAVVMLNSGNRQPVLALARPVSVGQVLTQQDLRQVSVAVDPAVSVVDAGQAASVVGKTVSTSLPAGALLPREAVSGAGVPAAGQAIAALSLTPGQFPPEVAPGTPVAVVLVSGPSGSTLTGPPPPESARVWPAVVTRVSVPEHQQTTVVSVQMSEDAARQVAAVPAGQLSLVMLSPGGGR